MPARMASAAASDSTAREQPTKTWLMSLVAWPAPFGPIRVKRWARWATMGSARAKSASAPPAMMVSLPVSEPTTPPETGASIQPIPVSSRRRAAMSRAASGRIEDMSTSSLPGAAPAASPFSPNTTASTASVSDRQVKTISASRATWAAVSTALAPAALAASSLTGLRPQTLSGKPALARRSAIGAPIRPRPI